MRRTHYETKILSQDRNSTESGRSMVEMLGVLAIIGVISIGAIAGYTYGMNRYRTNEVLDGGSKRAYTVATQLSMGLEPNLSEFKDVDATAGGVFGDTDAIKQWDGEFGISVTGVTKPVCENLIRMIGDKTPLRALSKVDGENDVELALGDCADGSNDFYLVYNIGDVGSSSSSSGNEEPTCPAERKYTFRHVEMCCPHDLSDSNTCTNADDGCSSGYELGLDGHTCCNTKGFYQDANSNKIYDFTICGCSDSAPYFYDGDCHACAKGECSEESQTFVAGASGTWDELNSAANNGCPEGYTWADKATAKANVSAIVDGTKCATCPGTYLWTSTPEDSSRAWVLRKLTTWAETIAGGYPALCVVD